MSNMDRTLSAKEVDAIAKKDDFHIAPYRSDGKTLGTPTWIWVVRVDDHLFVRAYHGTSSSWYQAAISQKRGKIEGVGMQKLVRFEPVGGSINDRIDEAYRTKYGGSPYLQAMISDQVRSATIKILPGV